MDRNLEKLFSNIDYQFDDIKLIKRALTHSSAVINDDDNDRLEFLGDRVLGLVIARMLFDQFPDSLTGDLAQRYNHLVRRETLAKIAESISLGDYINISSSEERTGGREKTAILADTCEALIAAIYLDGELSAAEKFILKFWQDLIYEESFSLKDSKSSLQEWSHANLGMTPEYKEISFSGPSHNPCFSIEVSLPGFKKFVGRGESKRKAQQSAAKALLDFLHNR